MSLKDFLNKECWEEKWSEDHKIYYVNLEKGISQWDIPAELVDLSPKWNAYMSMHIKPNTIYYIHKDSGKAQWEKPLFDSSEETLPIGWEKKSSRLCKNNYYVNTQTNTSHWYLPIVPRGLEWTGQSCYLDSSLFALFAGNRGPNDFVTNMLNMDLDKIDPTLMEIKCSSNAVMDVDRRKLVQKELKLISESIRRVEGAPIVKKCTKLREALIKCKGSSKYKKGETADSGEFITYLTALFPIYQTIKTDTIYGTYNTEDDFETLKANGELIENEIRQINSSVIFDVQHDVFEKTESILLSSLLTVHVDVETSNNIYPRIISVREILKAPFLIFNLFRFANEHSKENYTGIESKIWRENEVFYEENISVGDDILSCYAIVIYTGSCHYVAVAKYEDFWYYYDDYIKTVNSKYAMIQFNSIEEIVEASENYDDILNPLTNGTQFYYK